MSQKIAILGASGHVGRHLVDEALRRGHAVTAVARHASQLGAHHRLTAVDADVQAGATTAALKGQDAVLSAIRFAEVPAARIIGAVKAAGVPRLLVVGGAATLHLPDGQRLLDSPGFPPAYRAEAEGGAAFLAALQAEPTLNWTFLSPSAEFIEGPRTGHFRLGHDQLLSDAQGRSWISFADLAVAMLDELERPAHPRQRFTVGY